MYPKMAKINLLMLLLSSLLVCCSVVGVPYSSDPYGKINQAYILMDLERPIAAKDRIDEALMIFIEQGDELGQAEAYHTYGNFYKSRIYHKIYKSLKEYDPTMGKSVENFEKSLELYEKNRDYLGVSKCYLGIGNVYQIKGNAPLACNFYDKSLEAYLEAKKLDPDVEMPVRVKPKDFIELITEFKRQTGCN